MKNFILNLVYAANNLGIKIWVENDKLKFKAPNNLVEHQIFNDLKHHKKDVINFLISQGVNELNNQLPILYSIDDLEQYPLSFTQEGLWFIEQLEGGTNAYHIPLLLNISHSVNLEILKKSLQAIFQRHSILRSIIAHDEDGNYFQKILDCELVINEYHINSDQYELSKQLNLDINNIFDLSSICPIRVSLYRYVDEANINQTLLLINIHHIATDGWSTDVLLKEIYEYYEFFSGNSKELCLPGLSIQYKDFAYWQKLHIENNRLETQITYWRNKLEGFQPLSLPTDRSRPKKVNYDGAKVNFYLTKDISDKLRNMAEDQDCSLYTVLLSSFYILLSKYSGQDDIVVGTPIANRQYNQLQDLIGFFINSLVIRALINKDHTVYELISQIHQTLIDAQRYQDLPFDRLVSSFNLERDLSRHPIFQIMFGVQSFGKNNNEKQEQLFTPVTLDGVSYEVSKFDLECFIDDSEPEITGVFTYATSLYDESTIIAMVERYKLILEQVVNESHVPIKDYRILSAKEYKTIVYDWNDTDKNYSSNKTIHQLFEEQVSKTPNSVAVSFEGSSLTYEELNFRSNQLARKLRHEYFKIIGTELQPDTIVTICFERSLEMIIAIVAILKAGGAYAPLEPDYPPERLNYILGNTETKILLTQTKHVIKLQNIVDPNLVSVIDVSNYKSYQTESGSSLQENAQPKSLAYVIYTSGTTGMPKGAPTTHRLLVNRLEWQQHQYDFGSKDRVLQKTPYVFDVSVWELLLPIISGGTLVFAKVDGHKDPEYLYDFITKQKITKLHFVPSMLDVFLLCLENKDINEVRHNFKCINDVLCSGEALSLNHVKRFKALLPMVKLHNLCGATEVAIDSYSYDDIQADADVIHIGKPIQNTRVYILDTNLNPLPIGVCGELHIAIFDLDKGYINNPKQTADRFILNPFANSNDIANNYTHLYKTGDLVRWLPDGNIEYLCRNDFQVKIRGFRVEVEEIEHKLLGVKGIKQGCIIANKNPSTQQYYLNGYYVLDTDDSISPLSCEEILNKLSESLPDYMLPSNLIELDELPVTINGKLDRKALPEPELISKENYVAPISKMETSLCTIYEEVLHLSQGSVGVNNDFFKLGGNSILVIKLQNKLRQLPELKNVSIADIFKYKTIASLLSSVYSNDGSLNDYKIQNHALIKNSTSHEIAIIGISGAFSGANNIHELWELIHGQKEGIKFYSLDECKELGVSEKLLVDSNYIPVAGKIKDIEYFDPEFWGISHHEAKLLDPQIRKFIEHCWIALESSGYSNRRSDLNIGVFAGSGNSLYLYDHIINGLEADKIDLWEAHSANSKDALATKVSYLLGLTGPANSINTACSTGLVSIVEACKNLQLGTCDMALAGGVALAMPEQIGYIYQEGMIMSKDGHCSTFDKDASGTTVGSGVGVVLLKPLNLAIKDGDEVLAVIKGYSSNNDGNRKSSYTAPSVIGQSECIINAHKMAGVNSEQVEYVECHGTATKLGDPIEIQALKEAFEYNQSVNKTGAILSKTILGSIKANIGHTDSAAGTAGLIKVCLMLQHKIIPGQVNFKEPNPELNLDKTNFNILTENKAWASKTNQNRIASVSSFGVGGTNAHLVISDYHLSTDNNIETLNKEEAQKNQYYVIQLSARNKYSLDKCRQELYKYVFDRKHASNEVLLKNIAYTMQDTREQFNVRKAYVVNSIDDLLNELLLESSAISKINSSYVNKIVFMFTGQGSQYINMAKRLYCHEDEFKKIVDKCILIANKYLPVDLFEVLYPSSEDDIKYDINDTNWAQISLFVIEYSLAKYLELLDIKADAYIGHSIGEFVAATLCNVFSLEDAIRLVVIRGNLMMKMPLGKMLAINSNLDNVTKLSNQYNCEIAVINSPQDIVVSGTASDIEKLSIACEQQDIANLKLNTSHAYHSKMMKEASIEFIKAFDDVVLSRPTGKFISNISGDFAGDEVTLPEYWGTQLRDTVMFADGVMLLAKKFNGAVSFIEVGPGRGLVSFVNKCKLVAGIKSISALQLLASLKEMAASSASDIVHDISSKEKILAILWQNSIVKNANVRSALVNAKLLSDLPTYQFSSQKCWIEKGNIQRQKFNSLSNIFYKRSWLRNNQDLPSIESNCLHGKNILIIVNDNDHSRKQYWRNLIVQISSMSNYVYSVFHVSGVSHDQDYSDLVLDENIKSVLSNSTQQGELEYIIYISPSIDLLNPEVDYLITQRLFTNITGKQAKFISLSLDNYDVLGVETLIQHPSIMPGITRSIPTEFLLNDLMVRHVDLLSSDEINQKTVNLIFNCDNSEFLTAIRGRYKWSAQYDNFELVDCKNSQNNQLSEDSKTILITGGLGGIGYAFAKQVIDNTLGMFIILLGRTNESELRIDQKKRLDDLRSANSNHKIIYIKFDISDTSLFLFKRLNEYGIKCLDFVLHAAGTAAKSAVTIKTQNDILGVLQPKINGFETLRELSKSIPIDTLINCSSTSSIIPSIGNMEYAAANLYLDEISYRNIATIKRILTVNLNQISDAGMAVDFMSSMTSEHVMSLNSIKSYELPKLVNDLLVNNINHQNVILSRYDIDASSAIAIDLNAGTYTVDNDFEIKIIEAEYSEQEYKIALVFAGVLGVTELSIHDDFFKLGGNSILALRLVSKLKQLGINVQVNSIISNNTVSLLSKIASSGFEMFVNSIVVPVCINNESQDNVYFVHAVGGSILGYKELSEQLPREYNYYGIQNINIHGKQLLKPESLEELAKIYVDEILLTKPSGKILLGGASMGGTIAYEMAVQLKLKGIICDFVFMFDSWATFSNNFRKKEMFIENMELQQQEYMKQLSDISIDNDYKHNLYNAQWNLMQLLVNYVPKKSELKIVLFKALEINDLHASNEYSPNNHWSMYTNNIIVYDTPGDHISIMAGRGAELIVNELTNFINC